MKIAIISFGHVDSVLSLARHLGKIDATQVDLYIVFSQKYLRSSVLNLDTANLNTGLVGKACTQELLGKEINQYIENYVNCRIFVYKNVSLLDRKNFLLSYRIARYVIKKKYDVIHFNGTSGFLILLHYFLRKFPRVNTVHDPIPHSGEAHGHVTTLFKILFRYNIKFILHSKVLANEFIKKYKVKKQNVHSIYYGALEIYRFFGTQQEDSPQNSVLFFGRISPYKGIEYLLEASKIVKPLIPDFKVIVAGKGKYYFDVQNTSYGDSVEILNRYISNRELVALIQNASLVVCPYTDATQSGVVMTAYAFKKPVIASRVGGISEVIESDVTGKLVPPKNPELLADALLDLLQNPEKLEDMKKHIERKCSTGELSWSYIAAKTLDVYKICIHELK